MANQKPFFSIIIPALNEARYLPKLLGDLSAQTFRDFEVIIVDGHSDDATVAKAKALASSLPRLTILSSSRRHVCTQRNLGAKRARADIFIFMDADNRLPPYFLQGIKYRLESTPTDVATCYLRSDHTTPLDISISTTINVAMDLLKNSTQAHIMEAMVITTKQAFWRVSGFDENIDLSEGRAFLKAVVREGLVFTIYKDPHYTYSFRRIRKFGTLNIVGRLARHEISQLLELPLPKSKIRQLYPMLGGSLFTQNTRVKNKFLRNISKLIQDL